MVTIQRRVRGQCSVSYSDIGTHFDLCECRTLAHRFPASNGVSGNACCRISWSNLHKHLGSASPLK